jgi:hypothetical protein
MTKQTEQPLTLAACLPAVERIQQELATATSIADFDRYSVAVSAAPISTVTDKVWERVEAGPSRPTREAGEEALLELGERWSKQYAGAVISPSGSRWRRNGGC